MTEKVLEDGDYIVKGGVWLTVRNLSVRVLEQDEGVSITVYPRGEEACDAITETWAEYKEGESYPQPLTIS